MRIIGKIVFVLTLVLAFQSAKASHLLGGEITWSCTTNGNYIFTLTLYRDCNGITLSTGTQTIQNPFGNNIQCPFVSQTDVSPDCYDPALGIDCPTANNDAGAVEKYVYRSAPVTLNGIPAVNGSLFTWSSCCRPGGNQNTNTGGYLLRAAMYPYTPPGANTANNVSTCYDSSPIFAEGGSPVVCTGYNFVYNHLAADADLDSIAFNWDWPWSGVNTNIIWNTGYSINAPFPDASEDASNGPVTLDPVSGEMTMSVNSFGASASSGSFASCIAIESWRDCQLIARVYRDVAISFRDDCPANGVPDTKIDTAVVPNMTRNGNIYRVWTYPTDTVQFDIQSTDIDFLGNGSPQTINFEAGGLQASNPLGSGTGCLGSGDCAKFTPIHPQTGYSQGLQNNIHFEWVPDCGHLGTLGNGCGSITSTYFFTLKMFDDGCPAPAVSITTLIIDVIPGDPTPPPLASLFQNTNGDVDIHWNQAVTDSLLPHNYYKIFGSSNFGGPYSLVDSIAPIDSLTTTSLSSSGFSCFYMIRSSGACDFLSRSSDTLCVMQLQMTVAPLPPNADTAKLKWTPLDVPLPASARKYYEIWADIGLTGNWIKKGEIPEQHNVGANFQYEYWDTASTCDDSVAYQIRVLDTLGFFISGSTYTKDRFSDKANNDIVAMDSAAVDPNTGLALLSWSATASTDIQAYYILFNDPIQGWMFVDTVDIDTVNFPYSWSGSNATQRSEQFKVVNADSCGNQSNELFVVSHTTMYMRTGLNPCDGYVDIGWNTYEGFAGGTDKHNVYVSADNGSGFGAYSLLYSGSSTDTSFRHENLTSGTTYRYLVRAVDTSGILTSSSNVREINADVPQKSRILYIAQVTNNYARGSVDLKAFVDGEADISGFDIQRSTERFGIYRNIGNVEKPTSLPYVVNFSDFSADPEITYYYRLVSNNLCGGMDTLSATSNNIVLNLQPNENLTNKLTWRSYGNWGGGVGRYDIYRSVNNDQSFDLIGTNDGLDTIFYDQIAQFGEESGKFCYYVKAIEDDNPLGFVDDNGEPFNSFSNQVCKNQKVRIYVPTAFRPGSDVEANRTFGPSLRFEDIETYDFYVLNRWGSIMFRTDDPSEFWDGKINGELAPTGVYVYYLKFSTPQNVPQEERGTFTLVN